MSRLEHYLLWGVIVLIVLELRQILISVNYLREEVEEFRQSIMGEKTDRNLN
jgi:hypothetical protein